MVQILRDQTRQYVANQSDAIRTGQIAKNVGEWGDVVRGVGKVVDRVNDYRERKAREQAVAEADWLKGAQEADRRMIDTQVGSRAQTELLKWNAEQIAKGINPGTDEYTKQLYAKRDELYRPYLERMTTDYGRDYLQKQGLDTAERIRQSNIGKVAPNQQRAVAKQAFVEANKDYATDARDFGRLGDWKGFQEATADNRKAMVDYVAKSAGKEADPKATKAQAEFELDSQALINYMMGVAESDPGTAITMIGDEEYAKKILADKVDEAYPTATKKAKEKIIESTYERVGQEQSGREQLAEVLPESVKDQYVKGFLNAANAQKLQLQQELKSVPKGSPAYEAVKKQLDELQAKIDDPEKAAMELIQDELKNAVLPMARKQYEQNKLAEKQAKQDAVLDTYTMTLSPDKAVSSQARLALALGQPQVEELFGMSISDEAMHNAYDAYIKSDEKVLQNQTITFEGTEAMANAMGDVLNSDKENPLEAIKAAMDGYVSLETTPGMTQAARDNYSTVMQTALRDTAFADLTRSVLENRDRYYPDLTWVENTFSPKVGNFEQMGLPSGDLRDTDIDSVQKYLKVQSAEIANNTMGMLALAAKAPDHDTRMALGNQAREYFIQEKRRAYDTALRNYGIDVAYLREQKAKHGQAYTIFGFKSIEYMGDDADGLPIWRDVVESNVESFRKRLLDGLQLSTKESQGKAKNE